MMKRIQLKDVGTFSGTCKHFQFFFKDLIIVFSELIPIVSQLCKVIKAEELTKRRIPFTRSGFVRTQLKILSEDIKFNDYEPPMNFYQSRLTGESEFTDEVQSFMAGAPMSLSERDINKRILLEILATLAENSAILSYLFVESDTIDGKEAKGNSNGVQPPETILDMIAETTKKFIVPIYGLTDYWGLTGTKKCF